MPALMREAGVADADDIATLVRAAFAAPARRFGLNAGTCPSHPSLTQASAIVRSLERGTRFRLLIVDDVLVGCVGIRSPREEMCAIEKLAVRPGAQGWGFGVMLVEEAAAVARRCGANRLEASIIDADATLRAWYERRGFVFTAQAQYEQLPFAVGILCRDLGRR